MGALDDLPIGVSILAFPVDPGPENPARRVYSNHALAELFGYSLAEIAALPARLPVADDEVPRVSALFRTWMADESTGRLDVIDTAITTKDGRRVPIEARIGRGMLGGDRLILAFVSDISQRQQADDALRSSEELFRRLAERAPDAIVISVDGVVVYANHETARMLGYDDDELPGLSLARILEPDEVGPMIERMRRRHAGEPNLGPR